MRNGKTKLLLMVLVVFGLMACATTGGARGGKPAWVDGQDPKYPQGKYLTGVGHGDTRDAAENNARAEIAKIFSVKIEQMTQTLSHYVGFSSSAGDDSWLTEHDISQITRSSTDQVLQGVKIVDHWTDKAGTMYALAIIERIPARNRLEQQIADLDSAILELYKKAQSATDKITKLKFMVQTLEKVKEREVLNAQLQVVNPLGRGMEAPIDLGKFNGELSALLSSVNVYVELSGDDTGKIRQAIIESITRGRLNVVDSPDGADIIVKGKVHGMPVNRKSNTGFKFAQFEASVDIINPATGQVFGSIKEMRKEGAKDLLDAENICLMRLSKKIVKGFNEKLYSFLAN